MKRLLVLIVVCFVTLPSVRAGETRNPKLEKYLEGASRVCPDGRIRLETIDVTGPKNFASYKASMTSSDERCNSASYVLLSPTSGQVIVGAVWPLGGTGSLELRIGQRLTQMMGSPVRITLGKERLEDGLRRVRIQNDQDLGTVAFNGYLDQSDDFLILGRRGNVDRDPRQEFLEAIGASSAVTRGHATARVSIVELSDFQCPSCRKAHQVLEPVLAKYADRISYSRLDLPLIFNHDWSLFASMGGQAIARVAPEQYWNYVDYIFENQPEITKAAIDTVVRGFCDIHDIDWSKVEPLYRSDKVKKDLLAQVGRAFENTIFGTPTYIINGRDVYYGHEADFVREYLLSLLQVGRVGSGS